MSEPGPLPPPGAEGWVAVRQGDSRRAMEDWALVLTALAIPHGATDRGPSELAESGARFTLWVAAADAARAREALDAGDREEREASAQRDEGPPDRGRPLAPLVVALALAGVHAALGRFPDGARWLAGGSADARAILSGQLWRALTALTLHADVVHLCGNLVAGFIFLSACSRWLGGGLAVLLALLAGGLGNLLNSAYHVARGDAHGSIGASTAMFAALGILGGLQFHFRGRRPRRLARGRLGRGWPILAACLGLLAMIGMGEGRVDVGAHVFGLVAGVATGLVAARLPPASRRGNVVLGALAVLLTAGAWVLARG